MTVDARARILGALPVSVQGIVAKAYAGAAPPRGAIKAKCLECTGGLRDEIARCSAPGCPLWEYRPFRPKTASLARSLPLEATNATEAAPEPLSPL